MANKPETALVNTIRKYVEGLGGKVFKVHGSGVQSKGEPDIIGGVVWHDTRFPNDHVYVHFAVECKVGDNKPSHIQIYRLAEWGSVGFAVGIAYSLDDFTSILLAYVDREYHARNL